MKLMLLWALSGCIISSDDSGAYCGDHLVDPGEACDDGNNTSGDGCSATCELEVTTHATHAAWKVQNIDGSNAGCPAGYDQAAIVSWQVDDAQSPIGACAPGGATSSTCYLDYFDCVGGTGTTGAIPVGTYLTFVAIVSHDHGQVYAQSLPAVLDLSTGDQQLPLATIYNDGGYFTATWTLKGKTSGSTLSCDSAGASTVSILSTISGGAQGVPDSFACSDFANRYHWTKALKQGSYTESVVALDATGGAVGPAISIPSAAILGKNAVTDLGALVLDVDD